MHRRVILSALAVFGLLLGGASSAASAATRPAPKPALRYLGPIHLGAVSKKASNPPYDLCGGSYCLNDWNGGASIKAYAYNNGTIVNNKVGVFLNTYACNSGYTTTSCPWAGTPAGYPVVVIEVMNGKHNGWCIGDYGNSSTNASSGIVGCPSSGSPGGGWGDQFILTTFTGVSSCVNSNAFINIHWNPGGWSPSDVGLGGVTGNGSQVYNNTDPDECLAGEPTKV